MLLETGSDRLVLGVECLSKAYGPVKALSNVSLRIAPGEIVGLLGPNGAGKTTLVEIVEGTCIADAGTVSLFESGTPAVSPKLRQRLGVVLQNFRLPQYLTPRELLMLYGTFYDRVTPASELMSEFGLNERANSSIRSLSGGQQQRLAIALAHVGTPDLVLLDEPTSQLDAQGRRKVWQIAQQTARELGRSYLVTTHQIDEAATVCDRIIVIDHGGVLAEDTPLRLIQRYAPGVQCSLVVAKTDFKAPEMHGVEGASSKPVSYGTCLAFQAQNTDHALRYINIVSAQADGSGVREVEIRPNSLEDVFLRLTGVELRDGN